MRRGQLRDHFAGVGAKRLTAVDAESARSNQHEVGTTRAMRDQFLGQAKEEFPATYVWLGREQDGFTVEGTATHYDATGKPIRADGPNGASTIAANPVTEAMREGNMPCSSPSRTTGISGLSWHPEGSTSERQLSWLFGLQPEGRLLRVARGRRRRARTGLRRPFHP